METVKLEGAGRHPFAPRKPAPPTTSLQSSLIPLPPILLSSAPRARVLISHSPLLPSPSPTSLTRTSCRVPPCRSRVLRQVNTLQSIPPPCPLSIVSIGKGQDGDARRQESVVEGYVDVVCSTW